MRNHKFRDHLLIFIVSIIGIFLMYLVDKTFKTPYGFIVSLSVSLTFAYFFRRWLIPSNKKFINSKRYIGAYITIYGLNTFISIFVVIILNQNINHVFFEYILPFSLLYLIIYDYIYQKKIIEKARNIYILIFFAERAVYWDHPLFFGIALFLFFNLANSYNKSTKLHFKIETIIIIILALITIQVTYPIFKPRVEIIELGNVNFGRYEFDTEYGWREMVISITPPVLSSLKDWVCTDIAFGYSTKHAYNKDNSVYGVKVTHNASKGITQICTGGFFDLTKRIITLRIMSWNELNFQRANKNLTWFHSYSVNNSDIRVHEIEYYNYEDFQITLGENLTYYLTNETRLDYYTKALDYIYNNSINLTNCLKSFEITSEDEKSTSPLVAEIKANGDIKLTSQYFITQVSPNNSTRLKLRFNTKKCQN